MGKSTADGEVWRPSAPFRILCGVMGLTAIAMGLGFLFPAADDVAWPMRIIGLVSLTAAGAAFLRFAWAARIVLADDGVTFVGLRGSSFAAWSTIEESKATEDGVWVVTTDGTAMSSAVAQKAPAAGWLHLENRADQLASRIQLGVEAARSADP